MNSNKKVIIFDASTLINFAMNGSLDVLVKLRQNFNVQFIVPKAVKFEVVDHPMQIKQYELEALKINKLITDKILELPDSLGMAESEINHETAKILNTSNSSFYAKGKALHMVDKGEVSCIAVSILCYRKKIENLIAADERTVRMICENPVNLQKLLEKKLHTKIELKENFFFSEHVRFIRSSELMYIAYKKGLLDIKGSEVLDAVLYATKYKGNAISRDEIEEMKKLSKV